MPVDVLYATIAFLGLAVLTLSGLWVRAKDNHQQWSTEKITEHERLIALILKGQDDLKEIVKEHVLKEDRFQRAMIRKLDLDVDSA